MKRHLLATIARSEAEQQRAGDSYMAGPGIEPYLSVLRDALNRNGSTEIYSDTTRGFNWCCAFVYYCCLKAGFRFPPKPIETYRYTLGAVPAWQHWASSGGFYYPVHTTTPEIGDIALFNHVFDNNPFDHIGIILEVTANGAICAEGNNLNKTGIFNRPFSDIDGYVRVPENE